MPGPLYEPMTLYTEKCTARRAQWDEAKYPPRRPLKETVEAITDIVTQLEDQLKVRESLKVRLRRCSGCRRRCRCSSDLPSSIRSSGAV